MFFCAAVLYYYKDFVLQVVLSFFRTDFIPSQFGRHPLRGHFITIAKLCNGLAHKVILTRFLKSTKTVTQIFFNCVWQHCATVITTAFQFLQSLGVQLPGASQTV